MKNLLKTTVLATALLTAQTLNIKAQTNMPSVLSEKQQALITLALFEAKGDLPSLKTAINQALEGALTVNEAKEAFSHLYAYTGFPRSLNALGTLQQVIEERKAKGQTVNEGKDASPLPSDYDALQQGTATQTKLTGRPFNYTFAPATDYYLKAHLFGDIFARDVLSHSERELVTVSALASIKGVEPQLKSHVNGARNMGVTDAQLEALPTILRQRVGDIEAYRAEKAIAEVLGKTFKEGEPVENAIFPKGEPNTAYAKYFIGNSYLAPLLNKDLSMSNVTFEPGCRNNWHVHHKTGQILICVGGEGWYQALGEPARRLHPGDVVNIPAEVKHWHGATADSWFQHIAIHIPTEGATNEWLEPVTDEQYNQLK